MLCSFDYIQCNLLWYEIKPPQLDCTPNDNTPGGIAVSVERQSRLHINQQTKKPEGTCNCLYNQKMTEFFLLAGTDSPESFLTIHLYIPIGQLHLQTPSDHYTFRSPLDYYTFRSPLDHYTFRSLQTITPLDAHQTITPLDSLQTTTPLDTLQTITSLEGCSQEL